MVQEPGKGMVGKKVLGTVVIAVVAKATCQVEVRDNKNLAAFGSETVNGCRAVGWFVCHDSILLFYRLWVCFTKEDKAVLQGRNAVQLLVKFTAIYQYLQQVTAVC